jgi:hypothetical protein
MAIVIELAAYLDQFGQTGRLFSGSRFDAKYIILYLVSGLSLS